MSKRYRFGVGAVAAVMLSTSGVLAGDMTPPGPPGTTMRTLQEIYDKIEAIGGYVGFEGGDASSSEVLSGKKAWVGGEQVTGTMANVGRQNVTPGTTEQAIIRGYHDGTGTVAGDADLVAENIKKDVTVFGVTGKHEGGGGSTGKAAVQRTGQTTSYRAGDDGEWKKGVAWPSPRFTDHGDGTVTDNLTGLMWTKNANLAGGPRTWNEAIDYCNALNLGGYTDWRLPNLRELYSLIDYGRFAPALPSGHPFTDVKSEYYWSSSTEVRNNNDWAMRVGLHHGPIGSNVKTLTDYFWPVRCGPLM